MTGFGSASVEEGDLRTVVEIRSVNNRYLKIVAKAPPALNGRAPEIETLVREHVRRGTVTVTIHVVFGSKPPAYMLNPAALLAHRTALMEAAKREGITGDLSIGDLAALPGVFEPAENDTSVSDDQWAAIRGAVTGALADLVAMRDREGLALRDEFMTRKLTIEEQLEEVRERVPVVVEGYRTRLMERLEAVLEKTDVEVAAEDVLKETAIFADRADITEELARLASHLSQYDRVISEGGELGRRLEFILQEMLREANTIGAKANDFAVADRIVCIKTEIEKLKEQVQNLE
jgi:uncharacterized protein (TIGR00255 family)